MLIRCDHNTIESATRNASELKILRSAIHLDEFPLAMGRVYRVFAVAERNWAPKKHGARDAATPAHAPASPSFPSKIQR